MSYLLLKENKQTNQPTNQQIAHHLSTLVVPIHFIIPFTRNEERCARFLYFEIRIHDIFFYRFFLSLFLDHLNAILLRQVSRFFNAVNTMISRFSVYSYSGIRSIECALSDEFHQSKDFHKRHDRYATPAYTGKHTSLLR